MMSTTRYMLDAMNVVAKVWNDEDAQIGNGARLFPEDLYVVWFCKTLQNWKALVSTDIFHNTYWEVTHNGDRNETYVDRYQKASNTVVSNA